MCHLKLKTVFHKNSDCTFSRKNLKIKLNIKDIALGKSTFIVVKQQFTWSVSWASISTAWVWRQWFSGVWAIEQLDGFDGHNIGDWFSISDSPEWITTVGEGTLVTTESTWWVAFVLLFCFLFFFKFERKIDFC